MANRSDFFKAKLPRVIKRALIMGEARGFMTSHEHGHAKRCMIDAHGKYVMHKLKRNLVENRDSEPAE
jgi:hypothetical protein